MSIRRFVGDVVAGALIVAAVACSRDATSGPSGDDEPGRPGSVHDGFTVSTPAAVGISDAASQTLLSHAQAQHSDALIVVRNGQIALETYFGHGDTPIAAMSASKSFVSLAYGFMLDDGSLPSLDEKVVKYLPTFADNDPRKATMTIRHLLSQTSGLDPTRAFIGTNGNDIEAWSIKARLMFTPGATYHYSNNGVDFLCALAQHITGKPLDVYLNERLFRPLGITRADWYRDSRGVSYGAGGLTIRPIDLAKVGQTILDGGKWKGVQVIPASWIVQAQEQSSPHAATYGLLWWRYAAATAVLSSDGNLDLWESIGVLKSTTDKLRPYTTRTFPTVDAWRAFVHEILTPEEIAAVNVAIAAGDHVPLVEIASAGPAEGFYFWGAWGQYLYIDPAHQLVAVRMRRKTTADETSPVELDGFPTFIGEAHNLVP